MINKKVKISMIASIGKNRELGKNIGEDKNSGIGNVILWNISEDAKFYRNKTRWHVNVMGRKTFESLCEYFHGPPPKRVNVIITREGNYDPQKFKEKYKSYWEEKKDSPLATIERKTFVFSDIKEALEFAKKEEVRMRKDLRDNLEPEVMVVGGGQIFTLCLPYADRLYLTLVDGEFPDADTFFPDYSVFKKVLKEEEGEENGLKYKFINLEK